jgi:hypothetical protein
VATDGLREFCATSDAGKPAARRACPIGTRPRRTSFFRPSFNASAAGGALSCPNTADAGLKKYTDEIDGGVNLILITRMSTNTPQRKRNLNDAVSLDQTSAKQEI